LLSSLAAFSASKPIIDPVAEDYAVICLWVHFDPYSWSALKSQLSIAKAYAGQLSKDSVSLAHYNCRHWTKKYVTEHKIQNYQWAIGDSDSGVSFHIADDSSGENSIPNLMVRVYGHAFLQLPDLALAWGRIRLAINLVGGEILRSKLKRVDIAVDLVGVAYTPWQNLYRTNSYITRSSNEREYKCREDKDSGFTIGRHHQQLRIYDRILKLTNDGNLHQWVTHRWSGMHHSDVTRVEFQLEDILQRWIKDNNGLGCQTVEDYLAKRSLIIDHLVKNWIRFIDSNAPGRKGAWNLDPLWIRVQSAVHQWGLRCQNKVNTSTGCAVPSNDRMKVYDRVKEQMKSFLILAKAMATTRGIDLSRPYSRNDFIAGLANELRDYLQ
jgi:hypothetical protein